MDNESNKINQSEDVDTVLLINSDAVELDLLHKDLQTLGYFSLTAECLKDCDLYLRVQGIAVVICSHKKDTEDGIETLRVIASNYPEIERVLLTDAEAIESIQNTRRNASLCSFLKRPWTLTQLQYSMERALERNRLIKDNRRLQQKLLTQHATIAKQQKTLRDEMTLGGSVHKKMLLGSIPTDIPGFKAFATSICTEQIDGDFFEFLLPTSNTIDLIIGDVMGKGIPAALIGTAIKSQLIRFGLPSSRIQVMRKERIWEDDIFGPEEILQRVHDELIEQLIQFEYLATLFYARFYLRKRVLKFIDCGFSKPLHYIASENRITLLRGKNYPLGVSSDTEYKSQTVHFASGDLFVFYSDGVVETKNPSGETYGVERLMENTLRYKHLSQEEIAQHLTTDVLKFSCKEDAEEDITVIAICITHENPSAGNTPREAKFKTDLSQLPAVRDFVARSCFKAPGDTQQLSEQMQLAINEIFCNIVKHGFKEKSIGEIVIQTELENSGIRFDISDQGPSFNPDEIREPSLAGDRFEGFGWYMVKKIVDELVYRHKQVEDGWNHLELYKSYIVEELPMEIEHGLDGDTMIITPKIASLDAKDVPEFKEKVLDLIMNQNPTGIKKFILNLKQIEFVDSSGLGSFLSILRYLRDHGGALRISNMQKPVRTIFELVSMHKVFETYGTLEEAKNSFKK